MYAKVSRGFGPSCKNRRGFALRGFCPTTADDIGWVSTSQHVLDNIEKELPQKTETGKPTYKSIKN